MAQPASRPPALTKEQKLDIEQYTKTCNLQLLNAYCVNNGKQPFPMGDQLTAHGGKYKMPNLASRIAMFPSDRELWYTGSCPAPQLSLSSDRTLAYALVPGDQDWHIRSAYSLLRDTLKDATGYSWAGKESDKRRSANVVRSFIDGVPVQVTEHQSVDLRTVILYAVDFYPSAGDAISQYRLIAQANHASLPPGIKSATADAHFEVAPEDSGSQTG